MSRSLYLVDVSSMFFRAFYAIRPLSSPSGMPVNAVYGFLSMTMKLIRDIHPDAIAFCFDRPEPSFRKGIDPRYKANRTEMPEDLVPQVPWCRKLSEAMGIACFDREGFEADDIIGTLARRGAEAGYDVVIVSGDKDFGQLVNHKISLYDTMKDARFDGAAVLEKWGIDPRKMVDYLALVGDSSDNVHGVQGIGPKGAQKLLQQFESIEDIYEHIDQVKPDSVKNKLLAGREEAFLAKKLVTIVCDVPLDVDIQNLHMGAIDRVQVQGMLDELGFKTFARQLFGASEPSGATTTVASAAPAVTASVAGTEDMAAAVSPADVSMLRPGPYWAEEDLAISELASRLQGYSGELWLVHSERGLYLGMNQVCYRLSGNPDDLGTVLDGARLSGFALKDLAHRYKLQNFEVAWDAQLAAYVVLAGNVDSVHELFAKYLGLPLPDLASGAQWLAWHFALKRALEEKLAAQGGGEIMNQMEFPLVPILYRMEQAGIMIDRERLLAMSRELAVDIQKIESEIHQLSGEVFNIGSPKQLAQILFVKLGLPSGKKTKTGFSTDNDVLEPLAAEHPIAVKVLQWREYSKLKSTYVDAIPILADTSGRVHTTFNQALTTTGRLSSQNPNLQNIPIRTERGNKIREAFVASPGSELVSADYSQIELRILAHITSDPGLLKAFAAGHDIHAATAAEIFEVELSAVTSEMRRQAKAVNFGLAYGQGAFGLAETLGVPRGEAAKIIERYFIRFAKVKDYMLETVEQAKKNGYVETVFGRRRYLPELQSKNGAIKKFGERAAINAPIQGTASDLIKKAMVDIDLCLRGKSGVRLILQVHDELIFEVEKAALSAALLEQIKTTMESVAEFKVPLGVNIGHGPNWSEAH